MGKEDSSAYMLFLFLKFIILAFEVGMYLTYVLYTDLFTMHKSIK